MKAIGDEAFAACTKLTKLDFSSTGLEFISEQAFCGCLSLTEVRFPGTLTEIGGGAFCGDNRLKTVVFAGDAPFVNTDYDETEGKWGNLYIAISSFDSDGDWVYADYIKGLTTYVNPTATGWGKVPGVWQGCPIRFFFTVTFDANGGTASVASASYAKGETLGDLPTPTRDGYAFVGWFARASGGTRATSATKVTRSVTYYAHWTEVVVPVEGSERLSATFDGLAKRTFGGLVFDADGNMAGLVQLATAKAAKDGSVSVRGFVMLEDGKRQSVKTAKGTIQDGLLTVRTTVGKIGALNVTFGDDGFVGKLGEGTVASADVGEDTGILRGTIRLSYLDAKTGVLKTRQMTLTGLTDNGDAVGTLSVKGKEPQTFQAVVE